MNTLRDFFLPLARATAFLITFIVLVLIWFLFFFSVIFPSPAVGQGELHIPEQGTYTTATICGERTAFLGKLSDRFDEVPSAVGLTTTGEVLELLTSPTGSWSMLLTFPDGRTCLLASGEAWETFSSITKGFL